MSLLEMKVPSPGESISEVEIAQWLVSDGDYVTKDQTIAEVDSDKATLELPAEQSGIITLKAAEGDVVKVGQVVCLIDTSAPAPEGKAAAPKTEEKKEEVIAAPSAEKVAAPNPDPVKKEASYAETRCCCRNVSWLFIRRCKSMGWLAQPEQRKNVYASPQDSRAIGICKK